MTISIKIIANQKVSISEDEYKNYLEIASSHEDFGGAVLFNDLFQTNDQGIITLITPPRTQKTPVDVYLFILTLQQQQVLRHLESVVTVFLKEMKEQYDNR